MAYNPFDFFRRNQKTAFAALTIFVMFTFVLSFGQGDFFQWLPGWLASFRNRGQDVMATVDGRKVYDADLAKYDEQRALADQFMAEMLRQVSLNLENRLRDDLKSAGKTTQDAIQQFLRMRQTNYLDQNIIRMVQQGQFPVDMLQRFQQMSKNQAQAPIRMTLNDTNATSADRDLAKTATLLMNLDDRAERLAQTGTYFDSTGRLRSNQDRLEHHLWLLKADQLGITIRPSEAPAFVQEDLANQVTPEIWTAVEKNFTSKQSYNRTRLETALANEYRIKTAVEIVLGRGAATVTPYGVYQFYQDKVDAGTYMMMAVPAENFIDKVTQTPPESELRDLYDKYRNTEPDPTRETPGFREPRKLKIGWIEVTGQEPYYQKLGEQAFDLNRVGVDLATLSYGTMTPFAAPAAIGLTDPQLQGAYASYQARFEANIRDVWEPARTQDDRLIDTSAVRPQVIAAGVGTLVSSSLTGGSPLSAVVSMKERAMQYERNDRARVLATLLSPPLVGSNQLGHTIAAGFTMPKPLPLAAVRSELLQEVKADLTRTQAEKDLQEFARELTRLGNKKDKSDARSYVDKYVAERGLKHGTSTEFRDQYSIDEDPGLAVLVKKLERGHMMSDVPVRFGPRFFMNPGERRAATNLSYYEPMVYPDQTPIIGLQLREGEPTYLTWRTEVQEASTPREFDDARNKVVAAWKRMKARELAKKAAEELKTKIEEKLKAENAMGEKFKVQQIISDVHSQYTLGIYGNGSDAFEKLLRSKYFPIEKVAPIRIEGTSPFDVTGRGARVERFGLQNLIKKDLLYPTPQLQEALLENKDKPIGTTILEPDAGKDIYYVGVLVNRDATGLEEFRAKNLLDSQSTSPVASDILAAAAQEAARKKYENTIELLKIEFKVANESEKLKEKAQENQ